MSAQDDAKAIVDSFSTRTGPGAWLHIDRGDLAQELRERIDNPDLINQGKASLCGPADFFHDVATDDPVTYARAAIELYETGATNVGAQKIRPSHDLRIHLIPATANVNPADWILCASLRDHDNWFFDYQSETDDFAGITMPHSMADWFRKAGYTEVVNDTNLLACKDLANAKAASGLFARGYKVSLFINGDMLTADTQNDPSVSPDHWVGLTSAISFRGLKLTRHRRLASRSIHGERDIGRCPSLARSQSNTFYGTIMDMWRVSGNPGRKAKILVLSRSDGQLAKREVGRKCVQPPAGTTPIVAWHEVPGKAFLERTVP